MLIFSIFVHLAEDGTIRLGAHRQTVRRNIRGTEVEKSKLITVVFAPIFRSQPSVVQYLVQYCTLLQSPLHPAGDKEVSCHDDATTLSPADMLGVRANSLSC
jgi:hypothetical protein